MKFRNPFKSDIEHLISNEAENALYEKAANDIDEKIIEANHIPITNERN